MRAKVRIQSDEEKGKRANTLAAQRREQLKEKNRQNRDKRALILKEQKLRALKRREEKVLKEKAEYERKLAQIRKEKMVNLMLLLLVNQFTARLLSNFL